MTAIINALAGQSLDTISVSVEEHAYVVADLDRAHPGELSCLPADAQEYVIRGLVALGHGSPMASDERERVFREKERAEAEIEKKQRALQAALEIRESGMPQHHLRQDDGRHAQRMGELGKVFHAWTAGGAGLFVFSGATGAGKSYAAAQLLMKLVRAKKVIYWLDLVGLARDLYDGVHDQGAHSRVTTARRRAFDCDGLVLDDLGKVGAPADGIKASPLMQLVHGILDKRAADKKRLTVITTEYTLDKLTREMPASIARRISDNGREVRF